jgi:hypothetical protein
MLTPGSACPARGAVLGFFLAHARQIILEDVHAALRVVVEEAVERDLDVDRDHRIRPYRRVGIAARAGVRALGGIGGEGWPLGRRVAVRPIIGQRIGQSG